jgi:hypothetical protein
VIMNEIIFPDSGITNFNSAHDDDDVQRGRVRSSTVTAKLCYESIMKIKHQAQIYMHEYSRTSKPFKRASN